MTAFNTDYNNTELLDQELTTAELSQVSGGCFGRPTLEGYPEGCPEPVTVINPTPFTPISTYIIDPNQPMLTEGKNL